MKHSITITYSLMCQVCFYLGLVPLAHSLHLSLEFMCLFRQNFWPYCDLYGFGPGCSVVINTIIYINLCLWPRMPSPVFFVKNAFKDTPSRSSLQSTYRQAFTSFLRWLPSGHIAGKKGLEGQTGSSRKTGSPLCVSAFAKIRGGHHWD